MGRTPDLGPHAGMRPQETDTDSAEDTWGLAGVLGSYRRAEIAAARTALVLHHAAPMVFTQHQEGCLVGWAHQLILDHAVCAPAQLKADKTGVSDRVMSFSTHQILGSAPHKSC